MAGPKRIPEKSFCPALRFLNFTPCSVCTFLLTSQAWWMYIRDTHTVLVSLYCLCQAAITRIIKDLKTPAYCSFHSVSWGHEKKEEEQQLQEQERERERERERTKTNPNQNQTQTQTQSQTQSKFITWRHTDVGNIPLDCTWPVEQLSDKAQIIVYGVYGHVYCLLPACPYASNDMSVCMRRDLLKTGTVRTYVSLLVYVILVRLSVQDYQ